MGQPIVAKVVEMSTYLPMLPLHLQGW